MDEMRFQITRGAETVARAANMLVGRAAYETARRMYPGEEIDLLESGRVVVRSGRAE